MNLENLPVIDWETPVKLGNKREFAEEILSLLVKGLPSDISAIKTAYQEENYFEMLRQVHRLHGALCCCGTTPRLKRVTACLEIELRNDKIESLSLLVKQLDDEGDLLLERYSCLNESCKSSFLRE